METVECIHREKIRTLGHGIEEATCTNCGQKVQRNVDRLSAKPVITKLGRIDGKIVLPNHNYKLQLGPQDLADLAAARAKKPAAAAPGRPGKEDPKARKKWYRDNKRQMIEDLLALGNKAFLEKWGVHHTMIAHLKGDKLYKKLAQTSKAKAFQPAKPPGDKLPALPPWSDDWVPEVQVRWLDIYEKLIPTVLVKPQ